MCGDVSSQNMRISVFEAGFRTRSRRISKVEAAEKVATGLYFWLGKCAIRAVPQPLSSSLPAFPVVAMIFDYDYPDLPFNSSLQFLPALRYPLELAPRRSHWLRHRAIV